MATRPTLKVAVPETLNKASDYNNNFDLMMQFVDDSIAESKDYVDDYMPSPTGKTGKFLVSNGATCEYKYVVPIGGIMFVAASSAPDDFLVCDGSAISRETYSTLYAVIGTAYGETDSTTFRVPNLMDRYFYGSTHTGGTVNAWEATTGDANATHNHTYAYGSNGYITTGVQNQTHQHAYMRGVNGIGLLPIIRYQ